jgi:tRNA (guanine-N7-)-methyltransferase
MGKNKLQKFDDMAEFSHVFQFPFSVLQEKGKFHLKGLWNKKFFKNDNPIVLELGCGRGEYTVGLGRIFPDKNFIGIDIKGARMWSGAKEALENNMTNIAFLRTHIELSAHFFDKDEISEIWLTFPDPQMKKTGKRLTSTRFMSIYQGFLKDGGIVHLKTDSNFMFTYTCEMIKSNNYTADICTDNLYNTGFTDDILSIKTYYEQQWIERGIDIKYIRFVNKYHASFTEPDIEIEPDEYRSYNRSRRSNTTNKIR